MLRVPVSRFLEFGAAGVRGKGLLRALVKTPELTWGYALGSQLLDYVDFT